jgi:acetyl esterase/lipase
MTSQIGFRFVWATLAGLMSLSAATAETTRIDRHRDVVYAMPDEQRLRAEVYVPRGRGPFPGVLVIHGGAWSVGSRHQLGKAATELASHGYTAVAIDYRLAPEHKFPAQLDDCRMAVGWMRQNAKTYKIDAERIGAYGYSAGGHLAALLGVKSNEAAPVRAVVAGGAPCDLEAIPAESELLSYFLGSTRAANPEAYRNASPKCFVSKDDPPMLLFHGRLDMIVPVTSSLRMAAALKTSGCTHELLILPRIGHIAGCYDDGAIAASIKFLDRHLKPGRPATVRDATQ